MINSHIHSSSHGLESENFDADKQGFSVEVAGIRTRNVRAEDSDKEPDEGGLDDDDQIAEDSDNPNDQDKDNKPMQSLSQIANLS